MSVSKGKSLGQVWTPDWMVDFVLDEVGYSGSDVLVSTVLEPSFGAGAFLYKIVERIFCEGFKVGLSAVECAALVDELVWGVEYDVEVFSVTKTGLVGWVLEKYGVAVSLPNLVCGDALNFVKSDFFGFVVGNPPYVRVHNLPADVRFRVDEYVLANGSTDLYVIFYELGVRWLNSSGRLGFVAPNSWLRNSSQRRMRERFVKAGMVEKIFDFGLVNVFPSIATYVSVCVISRERNSSLRYVLMSSESVADFSVTVPYSSLVGDAGDPLIFFDDKDSAFLEKLRLREKVLGDVCKVQNGLATLGDKLFLLGEGEMVEERFVRSVVKASTYRGGDVSERIVFPYKLSGGRYVGLSESEMLSYPLLSKFFLRNKDALSARSLDSNSLWFWYGRSQALQMSDERKLVVSPVVGADESAVRAYVLNAGVLVYSGLFITEVAGGFSLEKLASAVGSAEFARYVKLLGKNMSGGYRSVGSPLLKSFPVS